MTNRPDRSEAADILSEIQAAAAAGGVVPSKHARLRMSERNVTLPEIVYVLETGVLEDARTRVEPEGTSHAVRGETVDGRVLRVVVALVQRVLIVTVVDLSK